MQRTLPKKANLDSSTQKAKLDSSLLNAFMSYSGVFNQDPQVASQFAKVVDPTSVLESTLESAIQILKGQISQKDLTAVIKRIYDGEDGAKYTTKEYV